MDSFYDQPRRAPIPRSLTSTANRMPSVPSAVPDASMLLENKGNIPQKKSEMSYNAWKYQFRACAGATATNKENTAPSKESILRKHVRFETPQAMNIRPHVPNFNVMPVRPSLVHRQFAPVQSKPPAVETERFSMPRTTGENKILQAKPFEKMYMANVPNRNLDLSIIEPPRQLLFQRSNSAPERFEKPFYKPDSVQMHQQEDVRRPIAESTTLELKKSQEQGAVVNKDNDEPTVKDLLKIIQQQNEQLMCLQQQVGTLLRDRSQQPKIEAPPGTHNEIWQQPMFKNKILDNVLQGQGQNGANKFAIDVMTSFEVSIRAPNLQRSNGRRFPTNEDYERARITEILDESSKNGKTDLSIKLNEPVVVDERCPSPENSIHVDMKDFSSDEEVEPIGDDLNSSMIGWTIYNNVMDQVNFMLKKSTDKQNLHVPTQNQQQEYTGAIMKQVKEATLKHLQRVGVNLNNIDEEITISTDAAYTPTQVSFAVKQLLMKYLPDEQLVKLTGRQEQAHDPNKCGNYPKHLIKRRPDFSMATVQYMEKYNLLNRDNTPTNQANVNFKKPAGAAPAASDKMLDITALKQQPKLL